MASFDLLPCMALSMVGFLLGDKFSLGQHRDHGREIFCISLAAVVVTSVFVFFALLPGKTGIPLALLLAGIAPGASAAVVREARAQGRFASTLLGTVALDDAWGLFLFSICLAAAGALLGVGHLDEMGAAIIHEIGGALLLGVAVGLRAAYVTGRIDPGEPTRAEVLVLVFVCSGLAIWMEVSFLIASMTLGVVVADFAQHPIRLFSFH